MLEFTNSLGESYEKEFVVKVINDDSDSDKVLLIRNVIVYSMSSVLFGFIIYKNKK